MPSPEQPRVGGGAPQKVKNLLAVFESGPATAPSSPAGGSREQSPGRLPKVRTSFVAIGGKNGEQLGLQKAPVGQLGSPICLAEGPKLGGDALGKEGNEGKYVMGQIGEAAEKNDPVITVSNGTPPKEEPVAKSTVAEKTSSPPKTEPSTSTGKKENVPPEIIPPAEQPKPAKSREKEKDEPAKAPTQPPKSPGKTAAVSRTSKTTNAKDLSVPTSSKAKVPSPQHSPVSTRGNAAPAEAKAASSKTATSKQPAAATTKTAAKARPTAAAAPTAKPRQVSATVSKPKASTATKAEPKPKPREATKTSEPHGSAFAPTASYAAKFGADSAAKSSGSNSDPASPKPLRRQNSMTIQRSRETKPAQRSTSRPPRPSTSNSHRPAAAAADKPMPPPPSSDFLSRMMRPTASSAKKVVEEPKKTVPHHPPKRVEPATRGRKVKEPSPPASRVSKSKDARAPSRDRKHAEKANGGAKAKVEEVPRIKEEVVDTQPVEPAQPQKPAGPVSQEAERVIKAEPVIKDEPIDEEGPKMADIPQYEQKSVTEEAPAEKPAKAAEHVSEEGEKAPEESIAPEPVAEESKLENGYAAATAPVNDGVAAAAAEEAVVTEE